MVVNHLFLSLDKALLTHLHYFYYIRWKTLEIPFFFTFIHYNNTTLTSPSATKVLLFASDFLSLAIFGPTTLLESSENLQALQQRRGTTLIFFEGIHLARAWLRRAAGWHHLRIACQTWFLVPRYHWEFMTKIGPKNVHPKSISNI